MFWKPLTPKPLTGVTIALTLLLAACGADGLPPTGALTADGSAAGSAYPSISADTKEEMPSPFGDPHAKPVGGREVIEKPTLADVFAPGPMPEMSWGRSDAPVTIVQYASLTCRHCQNFHAKTFPELKRTYIDTGKVRYVLREFPIGRQSGMATVALRCARPEKYLELYGKFMEQQNNWVSQEVRLDPIFAVAQQVGMTRPEFDACRENQGMIENLKWVKDRGRKLGIVGTPNYFVNDQLIKKELTMADIRELVEPRIGSVAPTAASTPR
ncbi:MAG: DsbA family protein [Hyphomicrobium sp.]|nr:DsbA family protein [Hyphomicrobium sp.]